MKKIGLIVLIIALLFSPLLFRQVDAQGDVTNFTSVMVSNFFRAQARPVLTVTNNGGINASGTFQRLTAASAVGTSGPSITIKPNGTMLTLVNIGANAITITETGVFTSAGNIVLGAGDSATLYSNGSAWTQVGASNN